MRGQLLEVRRESEALLQKRIRDVLDINLQIAKELEAVKHQLNGDPLLAISSAALRLTLFYREASE